jgi:hypothetical protein
MPVLARAAEITSVCLPLTVVMTAFSRIFQGCACKRVLFSEVQTSSGKPTPACSQL